MCHHWEAFRDFPMPTFPYWDWDWGSHSAPVGPKVPSEDREMTLG